MKRAHIIYCHPEPRSFVGSMAQTTHDALVAQGWKTTLSDLYAKKFNPVASGGDFGSRKNNDYLVYSLEQRHAMDTGTLAADIVDELTPVLESDLLVLVFPVFWFSMPAMMKGWIDRVFLSGKLYGGRRVYDRGAMVGRKAVIVTSLGGREHMFGPGSIHGELPMGMLRHVLQGTLGYVGYDVLEPFIAYHVPYISDEARQDLLQTLRAQMSAIDTRQAIQLPSLDDYDDRFVPARRAPA